MTTAQKSPRILCIGMPVRDLTFGVQAVPGRGQKFIADRFSPDLRRQCARTLRSESAGSAAARC